MELNTIFDYCVDDIICKNVFYYIEQEHYGNSCINIATTDKGKLLRNSNDWLHLLSNSYYPNNNTYNLIKDTYNKITKKEEKIFINEDVIPFITSFSIGTAHGYAGLFDIIYHYLENKDNYENYKIAIYSKSQSGILEIINHLCELCIIDKNKIIIIEPGIKYHFRRLCLIKVTRHIVMPYDPLAMYISNFTTENWLTSDNCTNTRLCIIKTTDSKNVTGGACLNKDIVQHFCDKYSLINVNPGINSTENDLICKMKNCEIFVTTWGTSYQKNYYYVSEKCKYIIVLFNKSFFDSGVYPDKNSHISQWCPNYFRNAQILYQVIDDTGGDIILTPEIEKVLV